MTSPYSLSLTALALLSLHATTAVAQASAQESTQLAPITVTATKRDQSLESVNGSVYVIPASELDASQVESTLQLDRVLPGVQIAQSGSFLFPVISVRGITSAQDFYNPALTVYVDGVPQLPTFAAQQLLDVDHVELLKGPQTTLYGRSALGGVLSIVSRVPDNETRLRLSTGLSSRDGYVIKGSASGALVRDLLYGSVSAASTDAPGRLNNPITGKDGVGGSSANAGAIRLRLAPADSNWDIGLAVSGECTRASQDAYVPYDDLGSKDAYVMPGFPEQQADFKLRRCGTSQALDAHYDFSGWRLSALAAWQRLHYSREYPIGPYFTQQPERWRQQIQELRLVSTGDRVVDSVFGLYQQRVTQSREYLNDLVSPLAINALDTQSRNTSRSLAAYADLTWHATRALDLSAGLRWSRDRASINYDGSQLDFTTFSPVSFAGQDDISQDTVTGKLAIGYQLNENWRAYASLAQGYKPAGYNLAPSSAADAQAYGREKALSQEIGARYLGRKLRGSLAFYRIDVRDMQLYVSDLVGYQHLQNVGKSRSTGVEFDLAWDVDARWTLGLEGDWKRARFRDLSDAACAGCGQTRVPFAPSYTLGASVEAKFGTQHGQWRPRLAVRRTGTQFFDVANTLRQDAYTLLDASLAWVPNHSIEVTAYINNLTDRRYRTYAFSGGTLGNFAQIGTGRTAGVTVAYQY